MFVQTIQSTTSDAEALRTAVDRWVRDLAPGATGWLGSTGGVSDDGRFIEVVRFESQEAARRNSDRPEQGQWWAETEKFFDAPVTFTESSDVTVDLHGDPDQAGFVQIMQGRSTDPGRAKQLMGQDADKWTALRPDMIGSIVIGHDGGAYTMVMYFTSEAEAREGERKEVPAELRANMEEMNKLNAGEPQFLDLKQPQLRSPRDI
jgi:hypothetical protein